MEIAARLECREPKVLLETMVRQVREAPRAQQDPPEPLAQQDLPEQREVLEQPEVLARQAQRVALGQRDEMERLRIQVLPAQLAQLAQLDRLAKEARTVRSVLPESQEFKGFKASKARWGLLEVLAARVALGW